MKALLSLVLSISAVAAEDAGVVSALADSAVPVRSFTFFDGRVITMGRHGARVVLDASF